MGKTILSLILAVFLLVGCRTTTETVIVEKWRDKVVLRVDSVTVNNTDTFKLEIKGDTVYQTTIRWRTRDVVKLKTDTVNVGEIKTVAVEKIKVVKVRDWTWRFGMWSTFILLGVIIFFVYTRIVRN
jgi:hypothetical protein